MSGKVYIVGAGIGGLDMLTLKAYKIISQLADVVVYDRLIADDVIANIKEDAERIYAGKQPDNHTIPQENINQLLVDKAKSGKIVVRLKGGDPFIYGRGGEEAKFLKENGVDFEIVPGITAAATSAAENILPLTYRNVADNLIFLTGHLKDDEMPNINFKQLTAIDKKTIVLYMGVGNIEYIANGFLAAGMKPQTTIFVHSNIGNSDSKTLYSNLENIVQDIASNNITNSAIIVIGEVAQISREINSI